jgi:hypothetical protein
MSLFLHKPLATPRYDLDKIKFWATFYASKINNFQLDILFTNQEKHGRLAGTSPCDRFICQQPVCTPVLKLFELPHLPIRDRRLEHETHF